MSGGRARAGWDQRVRMEAGIQGTTFKPCSIFLDWALGRLLILSEPWFSEP